MLDIILEKFGIQWAVLDTLEEFFDPCGTDLVPPEVVEDVELLKDLSDRLGALEEYVMDEFGVDSLPDVIGGAGKRKGKGKDGKNEDNEEVDENDGDDKDKKRKDDNRDDDENGEDSEDDGDNGDDRDKKGKKRNENDNEDGEDGGDGGRDHALLADDPWYSGKGPKRD